MVTGAVGLIAILWVASLFLPVWRANGDVAKGYHILIIGWLGAWAAQFQWYANPLIVLVCVLAILEIGHPILLGALAFGLVVLFVATALKRQVMMSTGGNRSTIERRYAGYYCWMAAVLLSAVLAIYLAVRPSLNLS